MNTGLSHLETFSELYVYSSGYIGDDSLKAFDANVRELFKDPNTIDLFRVPFYMAAGETDIALRNAQKTLAVLNQYRDQELLGPQPRAATNGPTGGDTSIRRPRSCSRALRSRRVRPQRPGWRPPLSESQCHRGVEGRDRHADRPSEVHVYAQAGRGHRDRQGGRGHRRRKARGRAQGRQGRRRYGQLRRDLRLPGHRDQHHVQGQDRGRQDSVHAECGRVRDRRVRRHS